MVSHSRAAQWFSFEWSPSRISFICYIRVEFTFGLPNNVCYNNHVRYNIMSRFCSIKIYSTRLCSKKIFREPFGLPAMSTRVSGPQGWSPPPPPPPKKKNNNTFLMNNFIQLCKPLITRALHMIRSIRYDSLLTNINDTALKRQVPSGQVCTAL